MQAISYILPQYYFPHPITPLTELPGEMSEGLTGVPGCLGEPPLLVSPPAMCARDSGREEWAPGRR